MTVGDRPLVMYHGTYGFPIFTVRATSQEGFDMSDITIQGNEVEIDLKGMRSIVAA